MHSILLITHVHCINSALFCLSSKADKSEDLPVHSHFGCKYMIQDSQEFCVTVRAQPPWI